MGSEALPRLVACNGHCLSGRNVLELGAGCGLISLLAARHAASVVATDGDIEEVSLIRTNCEQHAPCVGVLTALHLEWGTEAALAAIAAANTPLKGRQSFDIILGSQIVYVPRNIPLLVETIDFFLAPDGEMLLYNDAVSTASSQEFCRQELDKALAKHSLSAEAMAPQLDGPYRVPEVVREELESKPWAYLLRITRSRSEQLACSQ